MMPNIIYQELAADEQLTLLLGGPNRIFESQSVDERPTNTGYFLTINFEETILASPSKLSRGPRTITVAVHRPWEIDRDFTTLTSILNRVDEVLLPIEDRAGSDGVRVTSIRRSGRSGNRSDEGYKTITRTATYGVLHQEFAA